MNYQPTIDALNAEIDALETKADKLAKVRDALDELNGSSATQRKKSTLSAAGRKRIAAAQRARWAEQKRQQRKSKAGASTK